MKKTWLPALVFAAASLLGSCKSAAPVDEQEDVNLSFETVYNKYANRLILDGATDYEVVPGDTLTRISRTQYGAGLPHAHKTSAWR